MRKANPFAYSVAVLGLLLLPACSDDPTRPPDTFSTDELVTELAVTPDHVHVYESLVTFSVSVVDPNGDPVTDFELLQVERRLTGNANWSLMEASLNGNLYVVTHTFEASGEYEIRVTGLRSSDSELVVLYEAAEPLHAVRPHAEAGGYRLELEPDPGHIHEGDTSTVRFWIQDEESRAGIPGLAPMIWVEEADGSLMEYQAQEGADGLYFADHTFTSAGPTDLGIRFVGIDQLGAEWSLEIEVHEAH